MATSRTSRCHKCRKANTSETARRRSTHCSHKICDLCFQHEMWTASTTQRALLCPVCSVPIVDSDEAATTEASQRKQLDNMIDSAQAPDFATCMAEHQLHQLGDNNVYCRKCEELIRRVELASREQHGSWQDGTSEVKTEGRAGCKDP
ncbi:hypothetical protein PTSG_05831 [Salpingoeca rosetta]|uniref:RING-type domain-containing protein n=1 Tax=Salpingoeca rosetta (strain ATCC 50818 / BSB-021) TaxID=946362 RepID=F2UCX2_SALR5|nr:uncharacterized protein PTSG_05831 [Salpingoeca rosetta]EGD74467.1 hypothetical protein PTSG_05831 [Salpingoeca rosetta]|eukprot:XP_004992724.1 hypothetical protein PTSG_05831 [Salpingoeca rosetta]